MVIRQHKKPIMVTKNIISSNFKNLRKEINISQKEFSQKIEVPVTTISKYERGETRPSVEILTRLGDIFGVNINWLLTGQGEMFLTKTEKEEEKEEEKPALKEKMIEMFDTLTEDQQRQILKNIEDQKLLNQLKDLMAKQKLG